MAKQALLDVLEQTIGKYVLNLDAQSLNVAIWGGTIDLKELDLNVAAINAELDRQSRAGPPLPPVRVTGGQFGLLTVKVPWTALMSKPVVIQAQNLQVQVQAYDRKTGTAASAALLDDDAEERATKLLQERITQILEAEEYRMQTNQIRKLAQADLEAAANDNNQDAKKHASFGARLVRRIVENMHIQVSNVQVSLTTPNRTVHLGVVLESFTIATTNAQGEPTFVDRTTGKETFLHKALELHGLAVYLDDNKKNKARLSAIREDADNADSDTPQHSYLLTPLSLKARLRQDDHHVCLENAKYELTSELSSLQLYLQRWQLEDLHLLSQQVLPSVQTKPLLFPEYRPLKRVSKENKNAVEWWQYAVRCVGRLNGRRAWVEFFRAFQARRRYLALYKRSLPRAHTWLTPLTVTEQQELKAIEADRTISVEGLMTWRNMAEAQVDKEQEKYDASHKQETKGSLFTSLFGSSKKTAEDEQPPIQLSVEELKQLEAMTMEQAMEPLVSQESRLCDVSFLLQSLRINLVSFDERPLTSLEMGAVTTNFAAHANGSFQFDLAMTSLEIQDRFTPKTLFPTILRNQPQINNTKATTTASSNRAFRVFLSKAQNGDQRIKVDLNTFEMIASPLLVAEMKRFLQFSPPASNTVVAKTNPMLAQSLSGSIDLFYDAAQGGGGKPEPITTTNPSNVLSSSSQPSDAVSDFSSALIDVWKSKTEKKTSLVIDLDLQAPIVVIPDNCVDPRANILVFDLGHLQLRYGSIETQAAVTEWFDQNKRKDVDPALRVLDNGSLTVKSLTFTVGRANYWRRLVRKHEEAMQAKNAEDDAVVEPISLSIDFGVESYARDNIPRVCLSGVVPSIVLGLSPAQLSRVMAVVKSWQNLVAKEFSEDATAHDDVDAAAEGDTSSHSSQPGRSLLLETASEGIALLAATSLSDASDIFAVFHANVRLQRMSISVVAESGEGMEGHLISASAFATKNSDGSSTSRVSMGWFWVLDNFHNDFPRTQRLIAHSKLPLSADEFTGDRNYDILGELQQRGVFEDSFEGSGELADVTFRQAPAGKTFGSVDPFGNESLQSNGIAADAVLEAKFSTLHVNWNPHAVKTITSVLVSFAEYLVEHTAEEKGAMIISSPSRMSPRRSIISLEADHDEIAEKESTRISVVLVRATMERFEVCLRSARDDLPLFTLTVAKTKVLLAASSDQNLRVGMELGDARIATPEMGRTHSSYRTILGISPGRSDSLLSVSYYEGPNAMSSLASNKVDLTGCEGYGEVELSPMRMVYIQSQVLALVEYATAGILGALATQAATTAVAAAADIAASAGSKKIFTVKATGFEVVLPQAPHLTTYLSASSGTLRVVYSMMPDTSGQAQISLSDFLIRDSLGESLQEEDVQMSIDATLPPGEVGTPDDKAISVLINITKAPFVVSKSHYAQILATLDENMGEQDLCLRDYSTSGPSIADDLGDTPFFTESHAGVSMVDDPRRIYLQVNMSELSLLLHSQDLEDPLVRLAAVDASIVLKMLPDEGKTSSQVTLQNLVCEDRRLKAAGRQYRSLVYQDAETSHEDGAPQDVFFASYEASQDRSTSIDLKVGSPRLVFIPDAVKEILSFLSVDSNPRQPVEVKNPKKQEAAEEVEVVSGNTDGAVETELVTTMQSTPTSTADLNFSLTTGRCSVILVDMGSSAALPASIRKGSLSMASVAEVMVIQGRMKSQVTLQTDQSDGSILALNAELHGDELEAFTAFGRDMHSSLQVLDPAQLSLFGKVKADSGIRTTDIRCAAVTPMDLTLSMKSVALLNAIFTSVVDCIAEPDDSVPDQHPQFLSQQQAAEIQQLASALEADDGNSSMHSSTTARMLESATVTSSSVHGADGPSDVYSVKLTTPEVKVTLVNDLQGLDEALLRVTVSNSVTSAQVRDNERIAGSSKPFQAFDFSFHTSMLADYFDASSNKWKSLLLKPWEVSSKGARGRSTRFKSTRPSTTIDVESFPCHMAFSEQFLMSLASANRMWNVYSGATQSALETIPSSNTSKSIRRSMAASAARAFVSSLPYAVANNTGLAFELLVNSEVRSCRPGMKEYFRFEPPSGKGSAGKRLYGQDVTFDKSVRIVIAGSTIILSHVDSLVGQPKRAHQLQSGGVIVTQLVKEGKTTVLRASSGVEVQARCSVTFAVSVITAGSVAPAGVCRSATEDSHITQRVGLPVDTVSDFRADWAANGSGKLLLLVSPRVEGIPAGWSLVGQVPVEVSHAMFSQASAGIVTQRFDVLCRPDSNDRKGESQEPGRSLDPLVVQACLSIELIDKINPVITVLLEPRAVIENKMPIGMTIRSPMPHLYRTSQPPRLVKSEIQYDLEPDARMEVFTPGPSIAVTMKSADMPVGGTPTDWMEGGWIDLPLVSEFRMPEPLRLVLPLSKRPEVPRGAQGIEFFIAEGKQGLLGLSSDVPAEGSRQSEVGVELVASDSEWRTFYIAQCCYAVDHTGGILFEEAATVTRASLRSSMSGRESFRRSSSVPIGVPISAFSTRRHHGRISLLPGPNIPVCLLHLTMDGDEGVRRSAPFTVEDISISEGGVDSTQLSWTDGKRSGYFAYRQLVSAYQSEVHVIPEYVVFNGSSQHRVHVRQPGGVDMFIEPGNLAPLRTESEETAIISVEYVALGGRTAPLRVDSLGLRVAIVKSSDGFPLGSAAIQTVVGGRDSRLVVKLGDINFGSLADPDEKQALSMFAEDFIRFRVQWTELQVTLNEARPVVEKSQAYFESALDRMRAYKESASGVSSTWVEARAQQQGELDSGRELQDAVCTILLHRFTVDWQRLFKDEEVARQSVRDAIQGPERSQLSIVIHNVRIRDETTDSPYPIVFDSSSPISFFDLCIRIRGSANADLVKVDLFDLNLAHANGTSEKIVVNTSEDFVWKVLDLADRILEAASEFAGVEIKLEWDEEHDGYIVAMRNKAASYIDYETKYTPPQSDRLYDISTARVSPFVALVSFKRNPQAARYKIQNGVQFANLMNYFTRRLKFAIDRAELKFARYEARHVKGPADRLIELISTVYTSRMKLKFVSIMSAASFQDWKYIAARDGGDDAYVEGDILRVTGNLAGNSADFVFSNAGKGLSTGVRKVTSTLGSGIENATGAVGARRVGAGLNSVVSGVGDGVGETLTGVGSGAGQILKGAGKGVGHVFGGVTGGAMMMGKGVGKGIKDGDGRAVISGLSQGVASVGSGVGQGVESVVSGAAGGVMSVGKGVFSGVRSVGLGLGGALTGKKPEKKKKSGGSWL